MTGRIAVLLLAAALALALPATPGASAQQQDLTLYLTGDTGDAAGQSGVLLLSPDAPTGDSATTTLTPPSGTDGVSWYGPDAATDDLQVTGAVAVELYFGVGLDVDATTNVSLSAVGGSGPDVLLGSAEGTGVAGGAPHSQSFSLDALGAVVPEGSFLRLDVTVSGNALAVEVRYGGSEDPSALTLPNRVLDSDGDGVGDSEERRQGTDPTDASSTPGTDGQDPDGNGTTQESSGAPGNAGGSDGSGGSGGAGGSGSSSDGSPPIEALLGAFLLLVCLAVGGFALNRRFA